MKHTSYSLKDTSNIAREIYSICLSKKKDFSPVILFLQGDLGSGKTALVKEIAKVMGVEEIVVSPTYLLVKEYPVSSDFESLVHFDAYRLEKPDEIEHLGFNEFLKKNCLIAIEWPEKIEGVESDVVIKCADVDGNKVFELV